MYVKQTDRYDKEAVRAAIPFDEYYRSELGDFRADGKGEAKILCCFHDEKTPSLSININTGKYNCFACGKHGDIFKFRMERQGCSFVEALDYFGDRYGVVPRTIVKKNGTAPPKKESLTTLDGIKKHTPPIETETGEIVQGQFVRCHIYKSGNPEYLKAIYKNPANPNEKTARFFTLKNKAKGIYSWHLESERVLFNQELLEQRPNEPVIWTEGEKDAENVTALGLFAVTAGGANDFSLTNPDHLEMIKVLAGRDVYIFPDNDEPGRNHAQNVAQGLTGTATKVKIVELPGLKHKGDVFDYIEAQKKDGKKPEQIKQGLLNLIEQAPECSVSLTPNNTKTISTSSASVSVEPWIEPIPLNRYSSLPAFPVKSLPSPGREMVESVARVFQVDSSIAASLYLAALSTGLEGKLRIDLTTHTEPCNLYFAPMLDSGERKSGTTSIMVDPIYQHEIQRADEMKEEIRQAYNKHVIREKRLERLRKKAAETDDSMERMQFIHEAEELAEEIAGNPVPKPPIFIFDDITPEKLGERMADNNERGSIISPEGGAFDIMAGLYSQGKPNLDIYLKGHAGDAWSCHRIGRDSVKMHSPALTLCLAVQSSVIREIGQQRNFRGRGLLARFLYSFCQSRVGNRERQTDSIPESLLKEYGEHIKQFLDFPKFDKPLALTPEAQALWDEFYNDVEHDMRPGGSLEGLKDWGSKLPGAVARIAGLLHCAENGLRAIEQPISVSIVNASAVIGGYFKEHALAIFGFMGEDPKLTAAQLILEYLLQHRPATFTGRDVLRHKSAFKTMEEVIPGLNILTERGHIREIERKPIGGKGGRPEAPTYEINPDTLGNH